MTIDMTWERREELIRKEEREEGFAEGRAEGREKGLAALVDTLKTFLGTDFDKIAEVVRNNEIYKNVTDEDIRKYM